MSSDGNICDPISLSITLFVEEEQHSNMHASVINPTSIDCRDVLSNIDGSTDELLSNMIIIHDTSPDIHSAQEDDSYGVTEQQSLNPHGNTCGFNKT